MSVPSYDRLGLVNLLAEIERKLGSEPPASGLEETIPDASSYVLVLIDGLGDHQLGHPAAGPLAQDRRVALDAPFPTTTTVAMATVATGQTPRSHGLIGHLVWIPELGRVVNSLKWVTLGGVPVSYPTRRLLPSPNLWERLGEVGAEPITVQPADFAGTPLTNALYRGCRFVGYRSYQEASALTVELASLPRRLVFTYLPPVDYAAHMYGQRSGAYSEAVTSVAQTWREIRRHLPPGVALIGIADHGIIDYPESAKNLIRSPAFKHLTFYGDPRALMVRGDRVSIERLAEETGANLRWQFEDWLGTGPNHPDLHRRLPDALLMAAPGSLLLPWGFDKRLRGYHGGLAEGEVKVPLLVYPH